MIAYFDFLSYSTTSEERETTSTDTQEKQLNGDHERLTENTKQHTKQQKKMTLLSKKGWKKRISVKEAKSMADKKRLSRKFKGANKGKLAGLSAERLAAYGMNKKKKALE